MCGIAGYATFDGTPIDRRVLARMAEALRHRGPDSDGIETIGHVGFAHRRLAIIDLATGAQPMSTPDGTTWITFNGEIYNYLELREELTDAGIEFRTQSDTETILHLYQRFGTSAFSRLRGMFAFALYDRRRDVVILARDHFGIKPLYYYLDRRYLVFASELKALFQHPAIQRIIDPAAVADYLTFGYVPSPRCIIGSVRKVEPANVVSVHNGRASATAYWTLPFTAASSASISDDPVDSIATVLADSVRLHMRSDVPYAALLSGGIDSSIIVALMTRWSHRPVRTYSVGFEDTAFNELPKARRVAEYLGTDHHEIVLRPDGLSILPDLVAQFDEPFADGSAVPCFHIAKAVAQDVKVCLSGDGGDEVFGGYDAYRVALRLQRVDAIPQSVRGALVRTLTRPYPRWLPGLGILRCAGLTVEDRYAELMCGYNRDDAHRVLHQDFLALSNGHDSYDIIRTPMRAASHCDTLAQMQYVDFRTYLPDDILVKVDRTSMFHSLEMRVPLVDYCVLDAAARLPTSLKIRGRVGKYLLRQVASRLLPSDVVALPKHGFDLPLKRWLGDQFAVFAREVFTDRRTVHRGIFNTSELLSVLRDHCRGWRDLTHEVWSALMLELWCREYLDAGHSLP